MNEIAPAFLGNVLADQLRRLVLLLFPRRCDAVPRGDCASLLSKSRTSRRKSAAAEEAFIGLTGRRGMRFGLMARTFETPLERRQRVFQSPRDNSLLGLDVVMASLHFASMRSRFSRLTIPTTCPFRTTGTRLIR